MPENLTPFRINLLRAVYLLIGAGLALIGLVRRRRRPAA